MWFGEDHPANRAEPLLGRCQTAQRAEVRALVGALEATRGRVKVYTDSKFVTKGCERLAVGKAANLAHGDLWKRAERCWR